MGKSTKYRKYHNKYKKDMKKKKRMREGKDNTEILEDKFLHEYVETIKASKKYTESLEYLKLFVLNMEDKSIPWKFKSNLQTFIKKYILFKDIFGSKAFSDFQYYFQKMANKEAFVTTCEEIIRKINDNDRKLVYDLLAYKIKPLEEEEYNNIMEKIKKRCIILVENSG